jgi:hypothetical protein
MRELGGRKVDSDCPGRLGVDYYPKLVGCCTEFLEVLPWFAHRILPRRNVAESERKTPAFRGWGFHAAGLVKLATLAQLAVQAGDSVSV